MFKIILESIAIRKNVEVFILYNSFIFNFIYKRELCVIVTFYSKYDYLYKHLYHSIMIHIDHKPFTHFLISNLYENVYEH